MKLTAKLRSGDRHSGHDLPRDAHARDGATLGRHRSRRRPDPHAHQRGQPGRSGHGHRDRRSHVPRCSLHRRRSGSPSPSPTLTRRAAWTTPPWRPRVPRSSRRSTRRHLASTPSSALPSPSRVRMDAEDRDLGVHTARADHPHETDHRAAFIAPGATCIAPRLNERWTLQAAPGSPQHRAPAVTSYASARARLHVAPASASTRASRGPAPMPALGTSNRRPHASHGGRTRRLPRIGGATNWSRTTNTKGPQMRTFQWAILGSNQ